MLHADYLRKRFKANFHTYRFLLPMPLCICKCVCLCFSVWLSFSLLCVHVCKTKNNFGLDPDNDFLHADSSFKQDSSKRRVNRKFMVCLHTQTFYIMLHCAKAQYWRYRNFIEGLLCGCMVYRAYFVPTRVWLVLQTDFVTDSPKIKWKINCITQYVPVMTLDAILVCSFKSSWRHAGWVFDRDWLIDWWLLI